MSLRQRVSDLIDAGTSQNETIAIVNCSRATYFLVKRLKKANKPLYLPREAKTGRPRTTSTPQGLRLLRGAIKQQPRRSLREHGRRLEVPEASVRRMA